MNWKLVQIVYYMNTYEYQRWQGHCLTFVQGHLDLYFQTFVAEHIKVKFHVESLWSGGVRICSNDVGHIVLHDQDGRQAHTCTWLNSLKKVTGTKWPKWWPWMTIFFFFFFFFFQKGQIISNMLVGKKLGNYMSISSGLGLWWSLQDHWYSGLVLLCSSWTHVIFSNFACRDKRK